jgi:hypothetical protein
MDHSRRFRDAHAESGSAPILLKKSLLVGERIFLAPLARPASGDVRDHIDSLKSDH